MPERTRAWRAPTTRSDIASSLGSVGQVEDGAAEGGGVVEAGGEEAAEGGDEGRADVFAAPGLELEVVADALASEDASDIA